MAFCPNCGTPNTDQAEKCAACGFALAAPKQRAKFKGTIMMSGIKAPQAPERRDSTDEDVPEPGPQPAPRPSVASAPPPRADRSSSSFQRTMLGHPGVVLPSAEAAPAPTPRSSVDSLDGPVDADSTSSRPEPTPKPQPTFAEPAPRAPTPTPPPAESPRSFQAPSAPRPELRPASQPLTYSSMAPQPSRMLLVGCLGGALMLGIVGSLLYYALAPKLNAWLNGGRDAEAQAAAWHAQVTQALMQVSELCKTDCQHADVFFHPNRQLELLGEARALTSERVSRLGADATAAMLDRTDDVPLVEALALDPQQCVRVVLDDAKVISCSVPEPGSRSGVLRIVHLRGIGSL